MVGYLSFERDHLTDLTVRPIMTTLYLTEPQAVVRKDGDTLVVKIPANAEKKTAERKMQVPLMRIQEVVVYGDVTLTSPALHALLSQQTCITFVSQYGQFLGQLNPEVSKNSQIRLAQFSAHADYGRLFGLARSVVLGKLANQRILLMRQNRKLETPTLTAAIAQIEASMAAAEKLCATANDAPSNPSLPQQGSPLGKLQGLEGVAAAAYFDCFPELLRGQWDFPKRTRRPPTDPVNAVLSYAYTLLLHQVKSAIQIVGLDPYIGFLHSSQYGKPALALDLMEEFRPLIADSVTFTLFNNAILQPNDFENELNTYRLTDTARRTFLQKFEERLQTEIMHPVFKYKASYRRCLELQVRLLAKYLQGDIPSYPPFVVR